MEPIVLSLTLSAYTLTKGCLGIWYGLGKTSLGSRPQVGYTAAAAAPCLRRGTHIVVPDEFVKAGLLPSAVWVIEDDGRYLREQAALGRCVIDLLVGGDSAAAIKAARDFGVRTVQVKVLNDPQPPVLTIGQYSDTVRKSLGITPTQEGLEMKKKAQKKPVAARSASTVRGQKKPVDKTAETIKVRPPKRGQGPVRNSPARPVAVGGMRSATELVPPVPDAPVSLLAATAPIDELGFPELVRQRVELHEAKKALEARLEDLNDAIMLDLLTRGVDADEVESGAGPIKVTKFDVERKTIDQKLLVSNGVPVEVIEKSTRVTVSTQLRVTPPKPERQATEAEAAA